MKKCLEVKNVSFSYPGQREVLKEITFDAQKGNVLAILGPNGSGKTTLSRLVDGQLVPDSGEVLLEDKAISSYSKRALAKKMAWVPQRTHINFDYSAHQIVLMGRFAHVSRFSLEDEKDYLAVERAMKDCKVWELKDRSILELSGGEWQRVLIARALAQESEVLLLDEPVSHLDIAHKAQMLSMLYQLAKEKALCLITILHDIELAGLFSDQILLLHKGTLKAFGDTKDVLTPKNIEDVFGVSITTIPYLNRLQLQIDYTPFVSL